MASLKTFFFVGKTKINFSSVLSFFFFFSSCWISLLCRVGELVVGGFLVVAVSAGDRWHVTCDIYIYNYILFVLLLLYALVEKFDVSRILHIFYFHSVWLLDQAESWYWFVCLSVCVCVCPPQKPGPSGTFW